VLVATDYFTKWMEVVPLKNMTHKVCEFAESLKIKLLSSSSYYAQVNGQAESSNKTLIKLIKKKIEENPKRWYEVLSEALWVHHISMHSATKVTSFDLVYIRFGQVQRRIKDKN
jgi:hypothetical protein